MCRIIYYSLAALNVSSDIFAHHQEHLNCITASGITYVCRCRLVSWDRQRHTCVIPEAVIKFRCSWWWAKYRSKHVEQPRDNKLSYTVASCWSFSYIVSWCTETWISIPQFPFPSFWATSFECPFSTVPDAGRFPAATQSHCSIPPSFPQFQFLRTITTIQPIAAYFRHGFEWLIYFKVSLR